MMKQQHDYMHILINVYNHPNYDADACALQYALYALESESSACGYIHVHNYVGVSKQG